MEGSCGMERDRISIEAVSLHGKDVLGRQPGVVSRALKDEGMVVDTSSE